MPLCTYMSQEEQEVIAQQMDDELRELCDDIKKMSGETFFVGSRVYEKVNGIWPFRRRTAVTTYSLYYALSDFEVQCILLPCDNTDSIGFPYSRERVGAYLLGMCGGLEDNIKKTQKLESRLAQADELAEAVREQTPDKPVLYENVSGVVKCMECDLGIENIDGSKSHYEGCPWYKRRQALKAWEEGKVNG